jgi:hypothetical protein
MRIYLDTDSFYPASGFLRLLFFAKHGPSPKPSLYKKELVNYGV